MLKFLNKLKNFFNYQLLVKDLTRNRFLNLKLKFYSFDKTLIDEKVLQKI